MTQAQTRTVIFFTNLARELSLGEYIVFDTVRTRK